MARGEKKQPTFREITAEINDDKTRVQNNIIEQLEKRDAKKAAEPVVEKKPEVKVEEKKPEVKAEEKKPETKVENTKADVQANEKASAEVKGEKNGGIDNSAENKEETKAEATPAKQWWDDEEKSDATTANKKEDKKVDVDYSAKIKEYEDILKDPEVEALLAAKKAGKSLITLVDEIKGMDVNKMSATDLYKIRLQKAGASEEEITEALSEFSSKPKWQQNEETQSIKQAIAQEQESTLKRFTQNSSDHAKKQQENANRAKTELDSYIKDLTDTEIYGVKITSQIAEELKNSVLTENVITNADGTYNIPKSVNSNFLDKHIKLIVKVNVAKAKAEGTKQVLEEMTRTNQNKSSDRLPIGDDKNSDLKEATDGFFERKALPYGGRRN